MFARVALVAAALACGPVGPAAAFMDLYQSPERVARVATETPSPMPLAEAAGTAESLRVSHLLPALGSPMPDLTQAGLRGVVPMLGDPQARPIGTSSTSVPDTAVCISAIRAAEEQFGIPRNLLLAIGLQEAGREIDGDLTIWPWSVNAHGRSRMFDTRAEAVAFAESERAAVRPLVDIGCMQINLHWHPQAFASIDDGFDPRLSADYAARFLHQLYQESGDWMTASGNYHSRTARHHQAYLEGVRRNLAVAESNAAHFARLSGMGNGSAGHAKKIIAAAPRLGQDPAIEALTMRGFSRRFAAAPPVRAAAIPSRQAAIERSVGLKGHWWGGDAGAQPRSIYTSRELEPVLPAITDNGPRRGD